jgi:SAM-dependent methyltransferase
MMGMETAVSIADLVQRTGAKRLLDYGSGRGYQYLRDRVHEVWGILPYCYDIGVRQLSDRPEGVFDGIICTDVLEHIDEEDLPEILQDLFGYVRVGGFVYLEICCRPAFKLLENGENVHLTVRNPDWWRALIADYHRNDVIVEDNYEWIRSLSSDDILQEWVQGLRA